MATDQDVELDEDLTHTAWAIIANSANWNMEDPTSLEWRAAAIRWRDKYHESLSKPEQAPMEAQDLCSVMVAEPVTDDPWMRQRCLELAISTLPLVRKTEELTFIERARYFEQYIKNGAFETEGVMKAGS